MQDEKLDHIKPLQRSLDILWTLKGCVEILQNNLPQLNYNKTYDIKSVNGDVYLIRERINSLIAYLSQTRNRLVTTYINDSLDHLNKEEKEIMFDDIIANIAQEVRNAI